MNRSETLRGGGEGADVPAQNKYYGLHNVNIFITMPYTSIKYT